MTETGIAVKGGTGHRRSVDRPGQLVVVVLTSSGSRHPCGAGGVLARIIEPTSKLDSLRVLEEVVPVASSTTGAVTGQ